MYFSYILLLNFYHNPCTFLVPPFFSLLQFRGNLTEWARALSIYTFNSANQDRINRKYTVTPPS